MGRGFQVAEAFVQIIDTIKIIDLPVWLHLSMAVLGGMCINTKTVALFNFKHRFRASRATLQISVLKPYPTANQVQQHFAALHRTKHQKSLLRHFHSPAKMKSWGMGSELLYTLQLTSKKNNKQPRRVSKKEDKRIT